MASSHLETLKAELDDLPVCTHSSIHREVTSSTDPELKKVQTSPADVPDAETSPADVPVDGAPDTAADQTSPVQPKESSSNVAADAAVDPTFATTGDAAAHETSPTDAHDAPDAYTAARDSASGPLSL